MGFFTKGISSAYCKLASRWDTCRRHIRWRLLATLEVTKTLQNLLRYVFWPRMQQDVARFVKRCVLYSTSKPTNRKVGLYTPLPVPTRPWESIFMDFLGGLPVMRWGHSYLFVVVDMFSKMVVLMPCKKPVKGEEVARLFFEKMCWK